MERLTWECELDGFTDIGLRDGVTVDTAICRLAAYENTGLEPEQVAFAKKIIEDAFSDKPDFTERLRELAEADRDGRCVVLSESMSPMVQIPGDTDVYCPNCAKTLSGGWPLSDAGDYRKMCQCPHCGQSIDDTKCAVCENEKKGQS